jgi:hypothetical protein
MINEGLIIVIKRDDVDIRISTRIELANAINQIAESHMWELGMNRVNDLVEEFLEKNYELLHFKPNGNIHYTMAKLEGWLLDKRHHIEKH